MSNESKCPQCGALLHESAPAGLCPNCLMALNLQAETVLTGDPAAAQPPLPPAQIAPHFPQLEILECLGRGGMGVVYKARQRTLNRFVALKLLAPERVREAKFAERFTREAQALAALNHPNIVTIYDFGQAGGFYFLLMEFVDGLNLRQLLRARKFTPEEALAVVPPLCDALQFAHDRGIVHRDIKPENLLLDKAGRVKVADFGIAKLIEPEAGRADLPVSPEMGAAPPPGPTGVVGTPSYSAPEQKTDPQRVDSRADIYSLGVVFYEMLTGELPGSRLEPPSRKVQIDVRLDEVVLRALETNPALRYQQASEVKTMVETIVSSGSAAAPAAPVGAPPTGMAANKPASQHEPAVRTPWAYQGLDYRSKATLFGLPWLHVTSGIDPQTGRVRVAKGIIAIGDRAKGVVAFGGMATGGFAFGGLAVGVFAFGGAAFGLVAFGGLAVALLVALGGGAVATVAVGGGAIGYLAFGGGAIGVHVLDAATKDPVARQFFLPWAKALMADMLWLGAIFITLVVGFGVGVPLWIRQRLGHQTAQPDSEILDRPAGSKKSQRWWLIALGLSELVVLALMLVWWYGAFRKPANYGVSYGNGETLQAYSAAAAHPNTVRALTGPPFVARLPEGGSIELLAVRRHPATNQPWWQPDGTPSAYDSSIQTGAKDLGGGGVVALARVKYPKLPGNWPNSTGDTNGADMTIGFGDGLYVAFKDGLPLAMTETNDAPGTTFGVLVFHQALTYGNEATLPLAVATGNWATLITVPKRGGLASLFASGARKEWSFSEDAVGVAKVTVDHLFKSPDTEYRIVAFDTNGKEHLAPRTDTAHKDSDPYIKYTATFAGWPWEAPLLLQNLREVRLQSRPFEQVEFRRVSLQPGHTTTLEVKDFGGATNANAAATPATPAMLAEPPKLQFLAWQDNCVTNRNFISYRPDGSAVADPAELKVGRSIDITRLGLSAARTNLAKPRLLTLWFSHPAFDSQSLNEVTLLDDSGQPIPQPWGSLGAMDEARAQNGNTAWLVRTLSAGAATNLPTRVTVRLRYTLGPPAYPKPITPDFRGAMSFPGGSMLNGLGQNADGKAFISIAGDSANMQTQRFLVTATTREGEELRPAGGGPSGVDGTGVVAMTFYFSAPLSNIAHFTIGTRPIRTMEWKDVVLPKN